MPLLADRVLESSITAGTGTLTLAGALTGYRTFNSAFSNGNVVYYTIDDGLGNWEVGYGIVGTGTLTRSTVLESSNANALVVFTSVSKRVFCTAPVPALLPDQTGNSTKILSTDGTNPSWIANTVGTVTSVTGTSPVVSSGGTTPAISMAAATTSVSGYLTSTDWNTFNGKYSTGGALGTPSSGTVTNLTGTASININGTVGASTASTGSFTTITASGYLGASGPLLIGNQAITGSTGTIRLVTSAGINYIQSGLNTTVGSVAPLVFGSINGANEWMRINSSGDVGIGTSSPAQKLSVAGTIESTTGGVKFPDGTTQTTAATAGITTGKAIAMAMIFGG